MAAPQRQVLRRLDKSFRTLGVFFHFHGGILRDEPAAAPLIRQPPRPFTAKYGVAIGPHNPASRPRKSPWRHCANSTMGEQFPTPKRRQPPPQPSRASRGGSRRAPEISSLACGGGRDPARQAGRVGARRDD